MNNNALLKELYKILRLSGWLDKATKYFREHPERFSDCSSDSGKIANINMSVSYQPESLSAVEDIKPNIFISIGNPDKDEREFNVYGTGSTTSRTWIDGKIVTWIDGKIVAEVHSNV